LLLPLILFLDKSPEYNISGSSLTKAGLQMGSH
jgi:hypothetical protein